LSTRISRRRLAKLAGLSGHIEGQKMRAFAFASLAAGILAAAPIAASAKTIMVQLSIPLSAGGLNRAFPSDPFPGFDPSLGTLMDATLSLTGPLTWITAPGSGNENSATLRVVLSGPIPASQTFIGSPGVASQINIDLNGEVSSIGSGTQTELLSLSDSAKGGRLSRTLLEGTVTYVFTPLLGSAPPPAPGAIPEPSTWTMMLMGFASLGYAAWQRKAAMNRKLRR
jgi:PEP-CTERM motif